MNIVIPMAGLGSRFSEAGYTMPKPLIEIKGFPMYSWAVNSLSINPSSDDIYFILLETMPFIEALIKDIVKRYSNYNYKIILSPTLTEGQAISVLLAEKYLNNNSPLLIHNSDTAFFQIDNLSSKLESKKDGCIFVFESNEERWSYAKEVDGKVVEVREKKVISNLASTGTYYFKKGKDFVRTANKRLENKEKEAGEYYIAPLYNDLIEERLEITTLLVDKFLCFGTPNDLELSLSLINNNEF